MDCKLELSERLDDLMKEKGITAKELKDITGISQSTISDIINGKPRNPGIDVIIKLSHYFKVSSDYLLGLSPLKSPKEEYKTINKITGLNDGAINFLSQFKDENHIDTMNNFLSSYSFYDLIEHLLNIKATRTKIREEYEKRESDYKPEEIERLRKDILVSKYEVSNIMNYYMESKIGLDEMAMRILKEHPPIKAELKEGETNETP